MNLDASHFPFAFARRGRSGRRRSNALIASAASHPGGTFSLHRISQRTEPATMSGQQKFYITTAISYPNGAPHVGHAYEAIATDAIARFERLDGKDVFFLTGTDEHGLKMKQTAQKEGSHSARARRPQLGALPRDGSGAEPLQRRFHPHHRGAALPLVGGDLAAHGGSANNGDIFLKKYAGWYSVRDEAFYAEKETTLGPDGVRLGPQGTPVEWFEEETFFFRLSAYQDKLLAHYEKHPDFILPPRAQERGGELRQGRARGPLRVAHHARLGHSACRARPSTSCTCGSTRSPTTSLRAGFPDDEHPRWRYWPADVHVIGKDILRFHAVYWPAFLMSAGIELPKRIFSHGFVLNRGEKMSKSVGNVVDPFDLVKAYGVDQVRYFFLREVVFGQDGNYNHEAIVNRINADLANDLGNLAQRSLSMIAKNCDGKIPEPGSVHGGRQGDPGCGRRPVRQGARSHGPAGASSSTWMPCGPWWRTPTATSRARNRGPSARRTSSAWRRSST